MQAIVFLFLYLRVLSAHTCRRVVSEPYASNISSLLLLSTDTLFIHTIDTHSLIIIDSLSNGSRDNIILTKPVSSAPITSGRSIIYTIDRAAFAKF